MSLNITCPRCGVAFDAGTSVQQHVEGRIAEQLHADRLSLAQRERDLRDREEHQQLLLQQLLDAERVKLGQEAEARARQQFEQRLQVEAQTVAELRTRLQAAEAGELQVRKLKLEVEEQARRQALELQQKLDAERAAIRAAADQEATERAALKQKETEDLNRQLREKLEDAQRKLLQGSQQTQGEAQEVVLEQVLQAAFPRDQFTPIAKGTEGADVLQTVRDERGRDCGAILWESKRTRNWSDGWIGKLAADRARQNATVAALATQALPKDVHGIGQVDDIWVCAFGQATVLAALLRRGILEAAQARQAEEGRADKMTQVYRYLTGPEFRSRAQAMVQALQQMREELDRERQAMQRIWSRREAQLAMAVGGIDGMRSDLQGIAGAELVALPGAEHGLDDLEAIAAPAPSRPVGDDQTLRALFLAELRASGGSAGNKALRSRLGWDEAGYDRIKEQLVARREIEVGAGRGGSVRLPIEGAAEA